MPKKTNKESTAIQIVHAAYYYVVIAGTVLAISIASFVLIRRVLIDTVLPDLKVDYQESIYEGDCGDRFNTNSRLSDEECQEREEKIEERRERQYRRERAEQYLYSVLTILIAIIVMGTHIKFFRPGR
jgi:predicted nucleic acid-binding Zn ribbon protein